MSAIGSVTGNAMVSSVKPESLEPPGKDTKNDHDKDDAGGSATSAVKPTVNTQGQLTGTTLSTKA